MEHKTSWNEDRLVWECSCGFLASSEWALPCKHSQNVHNTSEVDNGK